MPHYGPLVNPRETVQPGQMGARDEAAQAPADNLPDRARQYVVRGAHADHRPPPIEGVAIDDADAVRGTPEARHRDEVMQINVGMQLRLLSEPFLTQNTVQRHVSTLLIFMHPLTAGDPDFTAKLTRFLEPKLAEMKQCDRITLRYNLDRTRDAVIQGAPKEKKRGVTLVFDLVQEAVAMAMIQGHTTPADFDALVNAAKLQLRSDEPETLYTVLDDLAKLTDTDRIPRETTNAIFATQTDQKLQAIQRMLQERPSALRAFLGSIVSGLMLERHAARAQDFSARAKALADAGLRPRADEKTFTEGLAGEIAACAGALDLFRASRDRFGQLHIARLPVDSEVDTSLADLAIALRGQLAPGSFNPALLLPPQLRDLVKALRTFDVADEYGHITSVHSSMLQKLDEMEPSPAEDLPAPAEVAPRARSANTFASSVTEVETALRAVDGMVRADGTIVSATAYIDAVTQALDHYDSYEAHCKQRGTRPTVNAYPSLRETVKALLDRGTFPIDGLADDEDRARLDALLHRLGFLHRRSSVIRAAEVAMRIRHAAVDLREGRLQAALAQLRKAHAVSDDDSAGAGRERMITTVINTLPPGSADKLKTAMRGEDVRGLIRALLERAKESGDDQPQLAREFRAIADDLIGIDSAIGSARFAGTLAARSRPTQIVAAALRANFPVAGALSGQGLATVQSAFATVMALPDAPVTINGVQVSPAFEVRLSDPASSYFVVDNRGQRSNLADRLSGEEEESLTHNAIARLNVLRPTNAQLLSLSRLGEPLSYLGPLLDGKETPIQDREGNPIEVLRWARSRKWNLEVSRPEGSADLRVAVRLSLGDITHYGTADAQGVRTRVPVQRGQDKVQLVVDLVVQGDGKLKVLAARHENHVQPDEWSVKYGKNYQKPDNKDHVFGRGADPQVFEDLLAFCRSELSAENLLFYSAARHFIANAGRTDADWKNILDTFVGDTAPQQINVAHATQSKIKAATGAGRVAALEEAMDIIQRLVGSDTLRRFHKAPNGPEPERKAASEERPPSRRLRSPFARAPR